MRAVFTAKLFIAAILSSIVSCDSDDAKKDEPVITYATLQIANAPSSDEDGEVELTQQETCSNDSDSGLFQLKLSQGTGKPSLSIKIKGFSTQGATYTCAQASDNTSTSLGQKYDSCMVQYQGFSDANKTSLNTYAMHRESESIKPFTYDGSCVVEIEYDSPKVSGTVACTNLVQTHLEDAARNPIDAAINLDLAEGSSFFCNL